MPGSKSPARGKSPAPKKAPASPSPSPVAKAVAVKSSATTPQAAKKPLTKKASSFRNAEDNTSPQVILIAMGLITLGHYLPNMWDYVIATVFVVFFLHSLYILGTETFTLNFVLLCAISFVGLQSSFVSDHEPNIPFVDVTTAECKKGWGRGFGCFIAEGIKQLEVKDWI